jgi:hypothetical protein
MLIRMPFGVQDTIRSCAKWYVRSSPRKGSAAKYTAFVRACPPKTAAAFWPHAAAAAAKSSPYNASVIGDVTATRTHPLLPSIVGTGFSMSAGYDRMK